MKPEATPLPREHGAWGLLLQPFLAAAILAGRWSWALIPAFTLVFSGFLLREPLVAALRIRKRSPAGGWMWPLRWFAAEATVAAVSLVVLAYVVKVPLGALAIVVAVGAAFTILAVWMAVQNRQRSTLLQTAAVAGLSASAVVVALAVLHEVPAWTWWLWLLVTLHGVASVLSVHARLAARIAAAKSTVSDGSMLGKAYLATAVQALAAVPTVWITGHWLLAVPLLFSAAVHGWELWRLKDAEVLRERLQAVGFRMLGVSIAHTLLAIWALWKLLPATP
ncbi:hypothetical protein F183_A02960 [Bryobacterales bacterium F-183]|nr:hypothetical protein F183_A02960 [Bryobacterales bacterium F-183]